MRYKKPVSSLYCARGGRRAWGLLDPSAFAGADRGLVFGDMAALQDESADGKQEQEDKREVEFGAAELADHE
jgi:hypothetical protein